MSRCSFSGGPFSSGSSLMDTDGRRVTSLAQSHGSKLRYLPNTLPMLYDVQSLP